MQGGILRMIKNKSLAIAYIRVSTEEQVREGVSLQVQEEKIKAYCIMNDLELLMMIREEGVSGAKPLSERPGGTELLNLLKNKKNGIKHIIALKLDRLFRDAADCLNQTKVWDNEEIALHLLDMGGTSINTASAMGRFFITMAAGFAELERNLIAERTSTALKHKKQNHKIYGTIPLGFKLEGDNLIEENNELEIVRLIKRKRQEGLSYDKIAKYLSREKIETKKGGIWRAWTVQYIIQNDLYKEVS